MCWRFVEVDWRSDRARGTTPPARRWWKDWVAGERTARHVVTFTAGLLSFPSPCVLPLFPSYLSFVAGMSVSDLSGNLTVAPTSVEATA